MRKATMLGVALLAALALSVGAFAYPVVVGTHPLSTAHAATPATVTHPKTGDDNSTGNQTNDNETGDSQGNETGDQGNQTGDQGNETGDSQGNETGDNQGNQTGDQGNQTGDQGNETENETGMSMFNVTVDHNVTVTQMDNTTWVNGTITVSQNGTALVTVTFQIVASGNGSANVTINVTQAAGSETITIHGLAFYSSEENAYAVFGVAKATQNGSVLWWRPFAFGSGGYPSGN